MWLNISHYQQIYSYKNVISVFNMEATCKVTLYTNVFLIYLADPSLVHLVGGATGLSVIDPEDVLPGLFFLLAFLKSFDSC